MEMYVFFNEITDEIFNELEGDSQSKTLDEFFFQMIKMMEDISDDEGFVGSQDWDDILSYHIEQYRNRVNLENKIKNNFSRESIGFLNTFSVSDMGDYIEFYPLDSEIEKWGSQGLKIISILTRNGILGVNKKDTFIMSIDNYNLYKKAAEYYGFI